MSKKPAAIPLFADAYLADTMHLTTEEHGAYMLLLMAAWRQDDCSLPNDDKKLSRIVGMTPRRWKAIRATMMEFWTVENDRIYQQRLRKERGYVRQKSQQNSEAAKKRWETQDTENKQPDQCERISERNAPPPPPTVVEEETDVSSDARGDPAQQECGEVVDHWNTVAVSAGRPAIRKLSEKRRKACKARLRDEGLDAIKRAIDRIPKSAFLRGDVGDWNGADIDFLLRPDSVTKILEGKYDDRNRSQPTSDTRDGYIRALDRELGIDGDCEPARATG